MLSRLVGLFSTSPGPSIQREGPGDEVRDVLKILIKNSSHILYRNEIVKYVYIRRNSKLVHMQYPNLLNHFLVSSPYLEVLIKGGPQLWEAPVTKDLVELGFIRAPLLLPSIKQLLCLLASLLHVCWNLLTITLQRDINVETYKKSPNLSSHLRYSVSHKYEIW